jgi:deazaflavin-dependent oxidoreductase (nitroreductase family)
MLLTTTGRRSGQPRSCPLVIVRDAVGYAAIGSNVGGPTSPGWVHNLRAEPRAELTIGRRRIAVTAREVEDAGEWERIFGLFVAAHDGYADYVSRTSRRLPIFTLTAATSTGAG